MFSINEPICESNIWKLEITCRDCEEVLWGRTGINKNRCRV